MTRKRSCTADYVVDMGPGAGIHGGEVVAEGTPDEVMANAAESLTGQYLTGFKQIPSPKAAAQADQGQAALGARRARQQPQEHHRRYSARPLHLRHRRLGRRQVHLSDRDALPRGRPQAHGRARSAGRARARSRGSSISTRSSTSTSRRSGARRARTPPPIPAPSRPIRDWFAGLPEAKTRGYEPGRFSFNVKGGRCEACQGDGVIKIEMHFLPDIYVTCDVCKGKRYNRETLEIKFKGKSIADVLDMTVEEAARTVQGGARGARQARDAEARRPRLYPCRAAGDDALGRRSAAGEALEGAVAARHRAARSISSTSRPRACISTTCAKLLEVLHELVDQGNTVVVIEHNLEVIKTADWIVDLGPEGGDAGGEVVAVGTPEEIAANPASYTGQYLKQVMDRRGKALAPSAPPPSEAAELSARNSASYFARDTSPFPALIPEIWSRRIAQKPLLWR